MEYTVFRMTRRVKQSFDSEALRSRGLILKSNENVLEQLRKKLLAAPLCKKKVKLTREEKKVLEQWGTALKEYV